MNAALADEPLVSPPPSPPRQTPHWRLKIKAPTASATTVTLFFQGRALRWEDVKRWIHQQTGVPTTLFHLVLAINGYKLNNTDLIDAAWIKDWQTIVVVLKEK